MKIKIQKFPAPKLGRTSVPKDEVVYRAFREDGSALGMGSFVLWELEGRIRSAYPQAEIILPGVTPGE